MENWSTKDELEGKGKKCKMCGGKENFDGILKGGGRERESGGVYKGREEGKGRRKKMEG